jgi:2-keto-3-deoxy-L-rhamnonate aldolase RhmA
MTGDAMPTERPDPGAFRARLRAHELLVGTFVKTPSPVLAEVLGLTALDCVCLDAEHAPFGRGELDACLMALLAAGMPALVRVPANDPAHILNALDCGATGVVIPHVITAEDAGRAVRASHYGPGGRGYAGSPRGARYTTRPMPEQRTFAAATTAVVAQIEDAPALAALDEICRVPGLDAIFVGRMDLTVSLGADSPNHPDVVAAVERIVAAGRRAGVPVGMFVPAASEVPRWLAQGATFYLLGSDQTFVLDGARALAADVRARVRAGGTS